MNEFEEDAIRLSTHLDDLAEEIEKNPSLADHEALKFLSSSITKFLTKRLAALMKIIKGDIN